MKHLLVPFILFVSVVACGPKNKTSIQTKNQTKDTIFFTLSSKPARLVIVPENLYAKLDIDEWEALTRWTDDFEDFTALDTKGVTSFLEALEVQTKTFYKTKFPPEFEIHPVRSRLKVVLMQIQKAKFYASTQQLDRLEPALDTMYFQYNNFLNRIIDLGDEVSLEEAEED